MDENVQNSDVYLANNNNNTSNKNKSKSSRNMQPDPNDYARNDIDDIPIKPAANKNIYYNVIDDQPISNSYNDNNMYNNK